MKFGVRKPNIKKRMKARTTAKVKRSIKKSINPLYGKKGMGWVNNPKKALYNKVYNKTTISVDNLVSGASSSGGYVEGSSAGGCLMILFLPFLPVWWVIKFIGLFIYYFYKYTIIAVMKIGKVVVKLINKVLKAKNQELD